MGLCQAAAKLCVSETQVHRLIKKGVLELYEDHKPQAVYESGSPAC